MKYKEYPIRCKTCNDQIACFSSTYEDYLGTGMSREDALNGIGLTEWCCRISMMNPPFVAFNLENRQVVEGLKLVDTINYDPMEIEETTNLEKMGQPVFKSCADPEIVPQPVRPQTSGITLNIQPKPSYKFTNPNRPQQLATTTTNVQHIPVVPETIPINKLKIDFDALPILPVSDKFETPTIVGVSTINIDPKLKIETKYVGDGKHVVILNGRTYLAR